MPIYITDRDGREQGFPDLEESIRIADTNRHYQHHLEAFAEIVRAYWEDIYIKLLKKKEAGSG